MQKVHSNYIDRVNALVGEGIASDPTRYQEALEKAYDNTTCARCISGFPGRFLLGREDRALADVKFKGGGGPNLSFPGPPIRLIPNKFLEVSWAKTLRPLLAA